MSQPSRERSHRVSESPRRARLKKRVLVPVLLLVLGLALYFAPQLPPVRGWVLSRIENAVSNLGYDLSYERSAGNLWHGVTLRGAEITGPGVDTKLNQLSVDYTLPALLTGRLPFSVSVADVTGTINPKEVSVPQAQGGGLPIRPVLRSAEVNGVDLSVNDVPYTLPDLSLTDLNIDSVDGGLEVAATLATPEGEARVDGRLAFSPFRLDAQIPRVDLAVAKHWFDGIEGGQASGTVSVADGDAKADLSLEEGAVTVAGTTLTGVSGPVRYNNQEVTADLSAQALGGPVEADAVVDIPARQWRADVTGDAKLGAAAAWLARGRILEDAVTGDADVQLSLSGWQQISLTGQAQGQGEVYGRPLDDLNVDFGFETGQGTNVQAEGSLAGGPFRADLTPLDGGGFSLLAQADGVNVTEQFRANVQADLRQVQGVGGLTGDALLNLNGSAAGREVTLNADATAQAGSWNLDLSGQDALGASLNGEVALKGEQVTGEVRASGVNLENTPIQSDPINATLSADGPLSALPVTLQLGANDGLTPSVAGVNVTRDLSGQASAVVEGTRLRDLTAQFGPLTASGNFNVAERTGRLAYALNALEVAGRAEGQLSLENGTLELNEGSLTTQTTLVTDDLSAYNIGLPNLDADVQLNRGDTSSASVRDPQHGLDIDLTGERLRAVFDNTQLTALGQPLTLDGSAEAVTDDLTQSLELDLSAQAEQLQAVIRGDAQRARLELRAAQGLSLGPATLQDPLTLEGVTSLTERQATLSSNLGELDLSVDAAFADALRVDASLGTAQETLNTTLNTSGSEPTWRAQGTLPLDELGNALGLALSGTLNADLGGTNDGYEGQAQLGGRYGELPLNATLNGRGDAFTAQANTSVAGQPLTLSGQVWPNVRADVRVAELATLRVSGPYTDLNVTGEGELPALTQAGLRVPAQPWQVQASVNERQGRINLGQSQVIFDAGEAGWTVQGDLEQNASYRNLNLSLQSQLGLSQANSDGTLNGTLALANQQGQSATLDLAGTLRDLALNGILPADLLASADALNLSGDVQLDAQANLFEQRYDADALWRTAAQSLELKAQGQGGALTGTLNGEGLSGSFSAQEGVQGRLEADGFTLSPFVAQPNVDATLDGTLSYTGTWDGSLTAQVQTPIDATARLVGAGDALRVEAQGAQGALDASATGQLLPSLDLNVDANAAERAQLSGTLRGSTFDGTLMAEALETPQASVPAQSAQVQASLVNGLSLDLSGETANLNLEQGAWSGGVDLPFTLRGEPHTLQASVTGETASPQLSGEVQGPLVQGPISAGRQGAEASLSVDTAPFLPTDDAKLNAELSISPDLSWSGDVTGEARYQGAPLNLQASVSGQGQTYQGEGTLDLREGEVPFQINGSGADLEANTQLQDFNLANVRGLIPGLNSIEGQATGTAQLSRNAQGLRYGADLNATGTAQGQPLELDLSADDETGVRVSAEVAGTNVELNPNAEGAANTFDLSLVRGPAERTSAGTNRGDARYRGARNVSGGAAFAGRLAR